MSTQDKTRAGQDDTGASVGLAPVWDDPPPGMRADARRSRAKLLRAASEAFAQHGAEAPLEDIARRAEVGIGTLYRHFPTRLDLQSAVFLSQVKGVCSQADDLEFDAWVRLLTSYMISKRGLSRALVDTLGRDSELFSSCSLAMRETMERLLRQAQEERAIRPDVTAVDVLRLVHGIGVATEQAPRDADRLLSLMLDGLRYQG